MLEYDLIRFGSIAGYGFISAAFTLNTFLEQKLKNGRGTAFGILGIALSLLWPVALVFVALCLLIGRFSTKRA